MRSPGPTRRIVSWSGERVSAMLSCAEAEAQCGLAQLTPAH
jgi:hypothetical protein